MTIKLGNGITAKISLHDQLRCAILWNDVAKIEEICEKDKNETILQGYNPLFEALDKEHIPALQCMMGLMASKINEPNDDGYTPLMVAVQNNELAVAKILINAEEGMGPNCAAVTDYTGCTVLMHAQTPEMVALLLDTQSGAESVINARDADGYTMLMKTDDPDIFKILIEHGADVQKEAPHNITKLMTTNSFAIAEMCIKHGMNVNQYSDYGYPTITYPRNPDIIQLLIDHGADVNAQDSDHGYSLLMQAADPTGASYYAGDIDVTNYYGSAANCYRVANIALKAGANIHLLDHRNMTALSLAYKSKNEAVDELFSEYMEDPKSFKNRDKDKKCMESKEKILEERVLDLELENKTLNEKLIDMDKRLTSIEIFMNEHIDDIANYPAP